MLLRGICVIMDTSFLSRPANRGRKPYGYRVRYFTRKGWDASYGLASEIDVWPVWGDSLNIALLIFSVIVSIVLRVVGGIVHLPWLAVFTAIPVGLVIFRMFSKNIARRQKENQVFLKIFRRSAGSVKQKTARAQDTLHKYYRCPKCKQQLRVPKGRGKNLHYLSEMQA